MSGDGSRPLGCPCNVRWWITTVGMSLHCQVMDHDLWDVLAFPGDGSRPLGYPCIARWWMTTVGISLHFQVMDDDRWDVLVLSSGGSLLLSCPCIVRWWITTVGLPLRCLVMDCGPSPVIVSFCLLVHHTLGECELLRLSFFVFCFVCLLLFCLWFVDVCSPKYNSWMSY